MNKHQFSKILLYENTKGESDILSGMSFKEKSRFIKKTEDFQKLPFLKFRSSKDVEFISDNFYELKYRFTHPPYRGIAIIYKDCLVILLVFKGSGSNGKLNKNMPRAINRANDWKSRF